MKQNLILSILLVLTIKVFAKETTCIRFKLEITLDNDKKLRGEYIYYDMYCNFTDTSSFDEVLRKINYIHQISSAHPKILFYKNVRELPYRI